jgi:hypothetical protein
LGSYCHPTPQTVEVLVAEHAGHGGAFGGPGGAGPPGDNATDRVHLGRRQGGHAVEALPIVWRVRHDRALPGLSVPVQRDRHRLEVDPAERPADDPDVVGGQRDHVLQRRHVERPVAVEVEKLPTAQALVEEKVLTPDRDVPRELGGLGLGTTLQEVPFQRSVSEPEEPTPTAQTLFEALPSTPLNCPLSVGVFTIVQVLPFQRAASGRINGCCGEWSAWPTAHASVVLRASTPANRLSPFEALGVGTTDQVAASAGVAGVKAKAVPAPTAKTGGRCDHVRSTFRSLFLLSISIDRLDRPKPAGRCHEQGGRFTL